MKYNFLKEITVLSMLIIVSIGWSKEEVTQDFGTSYSLDQSVSLGKDFEIASTQKLALLENSSTVDKFYVNLEGSWEKAFFTLAIGGRWILDVDNKVNDHKIRLNVDGVLAQKFGFFKGSFRTRYYTQAAVSEDESLFGEEAVQVWKNRIKVSMSLKDVTENKVLSKFSPFVSLEIANRFEDEDLDLEFSEKDYETNLSSLTTSLGTKFKWNKHTSTAIEVEIEREWRDYLAATYTVIDFSQSFKF